MKIYITKDWRRGYKLITVLVIVAILLGLRLITWGMENEDSAVVLLGVVFLLTHVLTYCIGTYSISRLDRYILKEDLCLVIYT